MRRLGLHVSFSWRYGVIGLYRDRSGWPWIIYPVPFVRISYYGRGQL